MTHRDLRRSSHFVSSLLSSPNARLIAALVGAAALLGGCRLYSDPFGPSDDPAEEDGTGGGAGGSPGGDGGAAGHGGSSNVASEATVTIRFRATTAPFDHQDGLSGQTPSEHYSAVRDLQLYRDADDPNPVTIFDLGDDAVEIGYNEGDDTVVATVLASELPEGTYTLARTVHTYVRYQVDATMHVGGVALPGRFDCLQVLSDGALVDGQRRDHGYYEYAFDAVGQTFPTSGTDAPLPVSGETGGFSAVLEQGQWAYYYEVFLAVTPELTDDVDVVLNVNMHESFRWQDQDALGYQPGEFDTTPTDFEPVITFGANSYWMTLE
ncbi:MAG: hypothetical protein JRI23_04900 [Deltaproteobacteria bacterium]|jgi:hypothetical protein|nr:hypothetical protein [Deltaproteobacteria bacterium]MBW2530888.1 hypothetical protein [Deltaproteobacteria bacterium]